jgi:hypothetical protein
LLWLGALHFLRNLCENFENFENCENPALQAKHYSSSLAIVVQITTKGFELGQTVIGSYILLVGVLDVVEKNV